MGVFPSIGKNFQPGSEGSEMASSDLNQHMAEIGEKGRKSNKWADGIKIRTISRKILSSKIPVVGTLADVLYHVGIPAEKPTDLCTGVISVIAYKALGGDLNAAKMLFSLADSTLGTTKMRAEINALIKASNNNAANIHIQNIEIPTEKIREEAMQLGIFDLPEGAS